jgi:hypothetical protein
MTVEVGDWRTGTPSDDTFAVLLQQPGSSGRVVDDTATISRLHDAGMRVVVATDLLACTLLTPPGEQGADVVVGSAQRFGVPMMYGGPHAAFIAVREDDRRSLPGRLVGVSVDAAGRQAHRLALQTREQHIRREKATSNICTSQVLLAVIAALYAQYHGPEGLARIARRVHRSAAVLAAGVTALGHRVRHDAFFDTVQVEVDPEAGAGTPNDVILRARSAGYLLRLERDHTVTVALDETTTLADLAAVLHAFGADVVEHPEVASGGAHPGAAPDLGSAGSGSSGSGAGSAGTHSLDLGIWTRPRPTRARGAATDLGVPRPSGVPPVPVGDRDDAGAAPAGGPGPGAGPDDDPAGLVHDEAQRRGGDGGGDVAGVRGPAPVRARSRTLPAPTR